MVSGPLAGAADSSASDWQVFRHPRVVLFFPPDWQVVETPVAGVAEGISPKTGADDSYREKLVVRVEPFAAGGSTADPGKVRDVVLRDRGATEIVGEKAVRRGGIDGFEFEMANGGGEAETRLRVFAFVLGKHLFMVEQTGVGPDMGGFAPVFDRIIEGMVPLREIYPESYQHERFCLQFPSSWSVKRGLPGTAVAVISPKSDSRDKFRERVTVGFEAPPGGMGFQEYSNRNFEVLLTRLRGARKIKEGEIKLPVGTARELELSHTGSGERTTLRVVMFQSGGLYFNMICSGQEPDYQRFRPMFDGILNSFASPRAPVHIGES